MNEDKELINELKKQGYSINESIDWKQKIKQVWNDFWIIKLYKIICKNN